jgi:hypothetical protein
MRIKYIQKSSIVDIYNKCKASYSIMIGYMITNIKNEAK